jgi:DNA-binding LacI/PurR family transcriptional regulator
VHCLRDSFARSIEVGGANVADVTIQQVAKAAGVSPSTVSNFLNGRHQRMRAETRDRIRHAIDSMQYRPNSIARQLKTGQVPMIGVLVPTVINPFFGELAVAVEQAAEQRGYRVLLCNTLRDPGRERRFAEELASLGVRGMITASALNNPEEVRALARRRSFIVALDVQRDDIGMDRLDIVTMDNCAASAMAVAHLAGLGHRLIAHVTGPGEAVSRIRRLSGFRDAMESHGLDPSAVIVGQAPRPDMIFADADLVGLGRAAVENILALRPRPTAVLALNDMTAVGIITGLQEQGLRVPDDISVVGVDDISFAGLMSPALTTIRQPVDQMAEAAVARLMARIANDHGPGTEEIFQPELIIRASTNRLAA